MTDKRIDKANPSVFGDRLKQQVSILSAEPKKKVGRKPKNGVENASKTVTLKMTPAEYEVLGEKAGAALRGSYLIDFLRKKTELLK